MNHDQIPCHEVMSRLWAFLDDELDSASRDEVQRHLAMCERCYPRYDFQRAYFRLMQRLATAPAPVELRSRIFRALLADSA